MDDTLHRLWSNGMLAGVYLAGAGIGAAFLLALEPVCGPRWRDGVRSGLSRVARLLAPGAALVLLAMAGRAWLFPEPASCDEACGFWTSPLLGLARTALCVGVWFALVRPLVRRERKASVAEAGLFLVACPLTVWVAAQDWFAHLAPRWTGTIVAPYLFAGFVAAALAMLLVGAAVAQAEGDGAPAETGGVGDAAALALAFACLWTYFWYCQYLLTWYANLPEEAAFLALRLSGGWEAPFYAAFALKGGVPFLLLVSRGGRASRAVRFVAGVSLAFGQWLDLYVIIVPGVTGAAPLPGAPEAGSLALLALVLAAVGRAADRGSAVSGTSG